MRYATAAEPGTSGRGQRTDENLALRSLAVARGIRSVTRRHAKDHIDTADNSLDYTCSTFSTNLTMADGTIMNWTRPRSFPGYVPISLTMTFAVFVAFACTGNASDATPIEDRGTSATTPAEKARTRNESNAHPAGFTVATLIERFPGQPAPSNTQSSTVALDHLRKKEFDQALKAANSQIQANPTDPVGYNVQGGAYAGMKDFANARKSFEKALSLQPDYANALINIAQLDLQQKDFAGARKRYQAVLAKDPNNVLAMMGMAKVEANNKNQKQVVAWLERAKAARPEALAPRLYLADYYLRTKDVSKALGELTEAQRQNPKNPEVLDLLGKAQLADGQKLQAVSTYKNLVLARPDLPLTHYRLATAQISVEDFSGGAESLKKALQLKPDYVEAAQALAAIETRAGRHAEALALARQFQKLTPKSPAGLIMEGDVLRAQNLYGDSATAYERAFAIQQSSVLAIKLHAARTAAGKSKEADAKLQQWLKDHPDDVGAWLYLAGENAKAGRNKVAIEQYQLALKKEPANLLALNNLANLYQQEKDPRALNTAEQAYKLMPGAPTLADTLGWILVEQGKTARGLELLQKAAAQAPNNTEIHYHLAAALARSGNKAEARRKLENLLSTEQKFPQREAAQALLKQL